MGRFLFYCFLAYLLYVLIFRFILPIYRTTREVKKGFREMKDRMQQHTEQQNGYSTYVKQQKEDKGDYIDFEEVKE
jgi:hypothetical protein